MKARELLSQLNSQGFYVLAGSSFRFYHLMPGRIGFACPYQIECPESVGAVRYKDTLLAHGDTDRLAILYRLIVKGDNIARDVPLRSIMLDIYDPKDYCIVKKLANLNRMIKESNLSDMLINRAYEKYR